MNPHSRFATSAVVAFSPVSLAVPYPAVTKATEGLGVRELSTCMRRHGRRLAGVVLAALAIGPASVQATILTGGQSWSANFSSYHDFTQGVGSTGWQGAYTGNNPSSAFYQSSNVLTIADQNGHWEDNQNSGHLLYVQVDGDFTAECVLTSLSTSIYATAGLGAFDPSVTTGSPTVTWIGAYEKGFHLGGNVGTRVVVNGSQADYQDYWTGMNSQTVWMRMVRQGQFFQSYFSTDGTDWSLMVNQDIPSMPAVLNVGLWNGSFRSGNTSTATFSSFSVMAGPEPSPVPEIDPAGMGSVLALIGGGLGLLERRRKRA